jgi:DNA repair protein RadC
MRTIKKVELRVTRMRLCERPEPYRKQMVSSSDIAPIAHSLLEGLEQEVVLVFHLDSRSRILSYHEAGRGGVHMAPTTTAEILRTTILAGAAGLILAHNHPSGDTSPSREDLAFTAQAIAVAKAIGIRVVDHVIVGREGHTSFCDLGILEGAERDSAKYKIGGPR